MNRSSFRDNMPSEKTVETLTNESQKRNHNLEHYKLVMKLARLELNQDDCSYLIDKLREKDDFNHDVHKLVSIREREMNILISVKPDKWYKTHLKKSDKNNDVMFRSIANKFMQCIKSGDYKGAIIPYYHLSDNEQFIKSVESNKDDARIKDFLAILKIQEAKCEEYWKKIKGARHE